MTKLTIADSRRPFSDSVKPNEQQLVMTWSKTQVTAKNGNVLLHRTSGTARPGITALIGMTGAGKSTLLNVLAGQSHANVRVDGSVVLNGKKVSGDSAKSTVSYVPQEDQLDGNLTVGECLGFAARMQLGHMSDRERDDLVDKLLTEIGIDHVKDTIIGTPMRRGISGGQRKRVAVALGLLRQPRVLILDEPTCGLDSTCALNLVRTLRNIADRGAIVIMAIHQPQQAIFDLFDDLMCIRNGHIIYHGYAKECVPLLEAHGVPYDGITAHADHIIEAISPMGGQTLKQKEAACPLTALRTEPEVDMDENKEVPVETNVTKQPWLNQMVQVLRRLTLAQGRSYGTHVLNIICTMSCALLISAAYYDVPMTQAGTKLRLSVLFFCCVNQSLFGAMKVILSFPEQRQLMISERRMGFYTLTPFLVAFTIVDLVYTLIWPPLFALPVVFLTNLGQTATKFFGFVLMLYLDKICATALALMVVSVARSVSVSVVVLPMAIEVSRLFSGYYLAPNMIPDYFVWLDPLSYVKYAFVGVALNELNDVQFTCTGKTFNATTNVTTFGVCDRTLPLTGAELAHKNGYDYISYGGCVGALLAYLVFMRIVAYIALRFLKD